MPVSIRVPEGGLELPVMPPANAKPGFLYIVGLANGEPGPIVLAREADGMIQLGPLPPGFTAENIRAVTQLPAIKRVEVEGMPSEDAPPAIRVVELMTMYGGARHVVLEL